MIHDKYFRMAKRPFWQRRRVSFPVCGCIVRDADAELHSVIGSIFKCPQCKTEMAASEFWTQHQDKLSDKANLDEEATNE